MMLKQLSKLLRLWRITAIHGRLYKEWFYKVKKMEIRLPT